MTARPRAPQRAPVPDRTRRAVPGDAARPRCRGAGRCSTATYRRGWCSATANCTRSPAIPCCSAATPTCGTSGTDIPDDWPLLPMIGRKQPSILYTVGERHRERAAMISDALEAVDPFELRGHAEQFADELIDAVCAKGETDLVADYAALLPVRVLATLYGFSDEQGPGAGHRPERHDRRPGGRARRAAAPGRRRWRSCSPTGRREPADDVVSRMLADTRRLHRRGDRPGPDGHDGRRPPADRRLDRQLAAADAHRRPVRGLALRRPPQRRRGHERGAVGGHPHPEHRRPLGLPRHPARRPPHPRRRPADPRPPGAPTPTPRSAPTAPPSPAATTPTSPSATASTAARSRRRRSRRSSPGPPSRSSWTGCRTSTWPCPPSR